MTLILSEITSQWALQVSDRLLTIKEQEQTRDFDPKSNKTVIFHASDGIATLSYTGLAFLNGTPTDCWIASKLNGSEYPFDGQSSDFMIRTGIRRTQWPKIGLAFNQLAASFNDLSSQRSSPLRSDKVTIAAAGWQWYRRKRPKPFLALIGRSDSGNYVVDWCPRMYGNNFRFLALPKCLRSSEHLEISERLSRLDLPEAANQLIGNIRMVATRTKTVGADCMVVAISHPHHIPCEVTTQFACNVDEVPTQPQTTQPFSAYSPWIVGPNQCLAPALMVGASLSITMGYYTLRLLGSSLAATPPAGVAALFSPQKRSTFP